jgi:hypothetical protein
MEFFIRIFLHNCLIRVAIIGTKKLKDKMLRNLNTYYD